MDEQGKLYVYSAYVSWAGDSEVLIIGTEKSVDTVENGVIVVSQTNEEILYCAIWHLGHFTNSVVEAEKVACDAVEKEKYILLELNMQFSLTTEL